MGGFPDGSVGEESTCSAGDRGDAGSSQGPEGPQEGKWQPTPVFLPKKPHRQRSLASYSPKGCKEWTRLRDSHTHRIRRCYYTVYC